MLFLGCGGCHHRDTPNIEDLELYKLVSFAQLDLSIENNCKYDMVSIVFNDPDQSLRTQYERQLFIDCMVTHKRFVLKDGDGYCADMEHLYDGKVLFTSIYEDLTEVYNLFSYDNEHDLTHKNIKWYGAFTGSNEVLPMLDFLNTHVFTNGELDRTIKRRMLPTSYFDPTSSLSAGERNLLHVVVSLYHGAVNGSIALIYDFERYLDRRNQMKLLNVIRILQLTVNFQVILVSRNSILTDKQISGIDYIDVGTL